MGNNFLSSGKLISSLNTKNKQEKHTDSVSGLPVIIAQSAIFKKLIKVQQQFYKHQRREKEKGSGCHPPFLIKNKKDKNKGIQY